MRIGIVGSGKIGATAARLFVDAGHEIAIANSRGPESLEASPIYTEPLTESEAKEALA